MGNPALSVQMQQLAAERRLFAESGLYHWNHTYLAPSPPGDPYPTNARYLRGQSSAFHRLLCGCFDEALRPGGMLIGAIPRGHAKTTHCTIGGGLFAGLNRLPQYRKRNIIIIAKNQSEAKRNLRNITNQLKRNRRLQLDYGAEAMPAKDEWSSGFVANNDSEILLANGTRLVIYPFLGPIRGQMNDGDRAELVLLDDPEDDKQIKSSLYRNEGWAWILAAVLPALDPHIGSFMFLSTKLHHDSMLVRALNYEGFSDARKLDLKAIDEHGQPLWPEERGLTFLARERKRLGPAKFEQEYQNNPVADEDQTFPPRWWQYYNRSDLRLINDVWHIDDGQTALPRELQVYAAHDPAFSDESVIRSNSTGSATAGYDAFTNRLYVLDVTKHKIQPAYFRRHVLALAKRWRPLEVAIEAVLAQDILAQQLANTSMLSIRPVKHNRESKPARIRALAPLVENGNILLPAGEKETEDFVLEATQWTGEGSPEDDRLDAMAMLSRLIPFRQEDGDEESLVIEFSSRKREFHRAASGF